MRSEWLDIRAYATRWFGKTIAELNAYKPPTPSASGVQCLALVQLVKLNDYFDLAIEGFTSERFYPGLALLRVVYESAIWIQWCVLDEDPSSQIRSWRRYTLEEWRIILEELVHVYPHHQELLDQCQHVIDTDFLGVKVIKFGHVYSAFFKGIQPVNGDPREAESEREWLLKMPIIIWRELSHYSHAHANLEEHAHKDGVISRAPMPERTPYFAALAVLHLIWPIRLFIGQNNDELKAEFKALGLAETQPG